MEGGCGGMVWRVMEGGGGGRMWRDGLEGWGGGRVWREGVEGRRGSAQRETDTNMVSHVESKMTLNLQNKDTHMKRT